MRATLRQNPRISRTYSNEERQFVAVWVNAWGRQLELQARRVEDAGVQETRLHSDLATVDDDNTDGEWLTVADAADRLGYSTRQIYELVVEDMHHRPAHHRIHINAGDIGRIVTTAG